MQLVKAACMNQDTGPPMLMRALLLAVGSSIDNLAVGVSLGLTATPLRSMLAVNVTVAACNALGAGLATFGGTLLGKSLPRAAPAIAALAFTYLGWQECRAWWLDENSSLANLAAENALLSLALPMTLNNLAGGLAGGVAGIGPLTAAGLALAASFFMMSAGHLFFFHLGGSIPVDPRAAAGSVFVLLALAQVVDAVDGRGPPGHPGERW